VGHQFELLESVINVNNKQQVKLVEKACERLGSLKGKRVAMLGLAFKPNTDDVREAAAIMIAEQLVNQGAFVIAYDPVATENARRVLGDKVTYVKTVKAALQDADVAFIVTEWEEFKDLPLDTFENLMKAPIVFDGRNCYALEEVEKYNVEYHSIGRRSVVKNIVNI